MLTQNELKEILSYNQDTGDFRWLIRPANCVHIGDIISSFDTAGYLRVGYKGIRYSCHRLAWLYVYGVWPKEIDHINHNRKDNRILNLRNISHRDNMMNASKRKDNKSGVTGVCWDKANNKWQAYIIVNGKNINLGRFVSKSDAVKTRKNASIKYSFHENHGAHINYSSIAENNHGT